MYERGNFWESNFWSLSHYTCSQMHSSLSFFPSSKRHIAQSLHWRLVNMSRPRYLKLCTASSCSLHNAWILHTIIFYKHNLHFTISPLCKQTISNTSIRYWKSFKLWAKSTRLSTYNRSMIIVIANKDLGMGTTKKVGESMDPCLTPTIHVKHSEISSPICT